MSDLGRKSSFSPERYRIIKCVFILGIVLYLPGSIALALIPSNDMGAYFPNILGHFLPVFFLTSPVLAAWCGLFFSLRYLFFAKTGILIWSPLEKFRSIGYALMGISAVLSLIFALLAALDMLSLDHEPLYFHIALFTAICSVFVLILSLISKIKEASSHETEL